MLYPESTWEWSGCPGHFIGGNDCRFHLATRVGPWWVTTVGDYRPLDSDEPTEIGHRRLFETMVFRAEECNCGGVGCDGLKMADASERDFLAANTAKAARANHMQLCHKWAARLEEVA